MNQPDVNNRLKGLRIPIEVCVKYERMAGAKPFEELTHDQKIAVGKLMVDALTIGSREVVLTSEDYEQIAQEVKQNEQR